MDYNETSMKGIPMDYLVAEQGRLEKNFMNAEEGTHNYYAIYERLMQINSEIFAYNK
jgi:hypothetical protein